MRVLTTRNMLLSALTQASKSSDRRAAAPILGCALLSVKSESQMTVTGTDMDTAAVTTLDVASDEIGTVALQIKPLLAYVKSLDKTADVLIEATEGEESDVNVTSGVRSAAFRRAAAADFPSVSAAAYTMSFVIDAGVLAHLIETVKPAISTEETRYYLNGIHIGAHDGDLRFSATDGHRLMLARMPLPDGIDLHNWAGVILPRGTLAPLANMLGRKPAGDVRISIGDYRMRFSHGTCELYTKLVDGTFPEIDRFIPRGNPNVLIVDAAECGATAKSLDQLDNEVTTAVKFSVSPESGCTMSFASPEHGTSSVKLNGCTRYAGTPMEVGFQARYIRDLLGVVDGEVEIRLSDPSCPAVLTAANEPGWMSVLMPIRV